MTLKNRCITNMNGFERHGIKHSSASSINMYCDAPHMWVAQYLFARRGKFGAAAKSGVLVEEAVVNVLSRGMECAVAIQQAIAAYQKFTALGCSDADTKRGEGMGSMIELALEALAQYGEPEFDSDLTGLKQKKIELMCNGDGWQLPIIGYVDLHYPKHGVVVDLKTTMRMPSELSDSHHRQACIYQKCFGNHAVRFLYVTPKKYEFHECGDVGDRLAEIKAILNRQENFLRLGDKEALRQAVPVVGGSFYHDAEISAELFGV